jgi:hypothetical protein
MKPDRHEVAAGVPGSYRGGISEAVDRSTQYELERRIQEVEKQLQMVNRDVSMQTDQIKSLVNLNIT